MPPPTITVAELASARGSVALIIEDPSERTCTVLLTPDQAHTTARHLLRVARHIISRQAQLTAAQKPDTP